MNITRKSQQSNRKHKRQMAIGELKIERIGDEEFLCQAHH